MVKALLAISWSSATVLIMGLLLSHRLVHRCFQDGAGGGWSGAGPRAAGAEDGRPEEDLHQVDEQHIRQQQGEAPGWAGVQPAIQPFFFTYECDDPSTVWRSLHFLRLSPWNSVTS